MRERVITIDEFLRGSRRPRGGPRLKVGRISRARCSVENRKVGSLAENSSRVSRAAVPLVCRTAISINSRTAFFLVSHRLILISASLRKPIIIRAGERFAIGSCERLRKARTHFSHALSSAEHDLASTDR